MKEVISCYFLPWATGGVPGKHQLSRGSGFVPGADGTPFDIIRDVDIFTWIVDCFVSQGLHFLNALVGAV